MKKIYLIALTLLFTAPTHTTILDLLPASREAYQHTKYSILPSLGLGITTSYLEKRDLSVKIFYWALGAFASDQWCGVLEGHGECERYPEFEIDDLSLWQQGSFKTRMPSRTIGFACFVLGALCTEGCKKAAPYVKDAIRWSMWTAAKKLRLA